MANQKPTNLTQLRALAERVKAKTPAYSVVKLDTAETGFLASYSLTKDGVQVGAKINIPRDFLVKSAAIHTVETVDTPYEGAAVGDKYIDFVINSKEGAQSESHVYLPVNELVDTYTSGNGIDISAANAVSVKLDTANANGLAVDASGLKLGIATDSAPGAMSAADHAHLSGMSDGANKVEASNTNGNIKIDGQEITVYTLPDTVIQDNDFATDAEVTAMLDDVFGALPAADPEESGGE